MTSKERLDALLKSYMSYTTTMFSSKSLEEINDKCETVTNLYNNILEDLEVLEIIKKRATFGSNIQLLSLPPINVWELNLTVNENEEDFKKLKKWLGR